MEIIKAYAVNNLCYKAAQKMTPKGIVVHSTGANNPYLKRYVDCPEELGENTNGNHWNQPAPDGRKVCVHAFIGYDKDKNVRVAEILPLDISCWGIGKGSKGSYNYAPAYIQFEICEDGLKDKTYYQKAFAAAAEYCAELCGRYNIDIAKIVGHCEAYRLGYGSNHSDPEHWMKNFGETMNDFRNAVSVILKNSKAENKNENALNIPTVSKGDLVSLSSDATYYNGKAISTWVKSQNWYIAAEPTGNRVVIDKNEKGGNAICSPVHIKYLTVVKKANSSHISQNKSCNLPYLVNVTTDSLNIRKEAGIEYSVVGCITDRGTYTIVEEKNGTGAALWGRLKSGVGWISLDYVKKLK